MTLNIKQSDHTDQLRAHLMENIRAAGIEVYNYRDISQLPLADCRRTLPFLEEFLKQPIDLDQRVTVCEAIALWAKGGIALPLAQFKAILPELPSGDISLHEDFTSNRAWQIAEIIERAVTARDKDSLDDLATIVLDRRYGITRQMLAHALGKFKSRRQDAIRILLRALAMDDDHLTPGVIASLANLKVFETADLIRPYLTHPDFAPEARKALRKMGVAFEEPAPIGVKVTRKRLPHTTSIGCDSEQLPSVLAIVARHASELSERDTTAVVRAYEDTEPEGRRTFEFLLTWRGHQIRVRLLLIDGDEFHIYADSGDFIAAIEAEIDQTS